MGLLDDLLGGLAGQQTGGRARPTPAPSSAGSAGTSGVLMALLPIVLGMLSNRASQGGAPDRANVAPGAGGGLADVLGQVLGGAGGGGGLGGVLGQVLGGAGGGGSAAGGLGGLLEQFQRAGFGEQASSWVARGANKPISPDAMTQVFGREGIEAIARRAGIGTDEASRGLSELLPEVVDRITPDGDVPDVSSLTNSIDDLAKQLGIR